MFDFGKNWRAYSENRLDEQRVIAAIESLYTLLQRQTLDGLKVLDLGCGSGLFSIAAARMGAGSVIGIDNNPACITVAQLNAARFSPGTPIAFRQGSILDTDALQALGYFDVVYAWGSLHHTGLMWDAIRNAAGRMAGGGLLIVAIYNKHITSPLWKWMKWLYNRLPAWGQFPMAAFFAGIIYLAKLLVILRNPLQKKRGMDFWYDVIDWVGGYPYEYASRQEIEDFMGALGFKLERFIPAEVPTGCNEFVFQRFASEENP